MARRTIHPPKRAVPRICWRRSTVTRVPSGTGSRLISVRAEAMKRANGEPASSCSHARTDGARDATMRKSARSALPPPATSTSVKCSSVTASTRSTRGHQRGRWWGSATVFQTSSGAAATVRLRRVVGTERPIRRRRR